MSEVAETTYTVTYLEMGERPTAPVPARPANINIALLRADDVPVHWFLYLYGTVGADYDWLDRFEEPREAVQAFCNDPAVSLTVMMLDGAPGGFFMLDAREAGTCDLAYFGLMPEAIGRGLGRWFLASAIEAGWEEPGVETMTVNTCTLDHPRALGLYQRMGFSPVRREERTRTP